MQMLAPYTIRAKILMQQSWLRGVGWEDPLPTSLAELWEIWLEQLPDLASLQLPCCYSRKGKTVVMGTIHTFVDASEQACAEVSYFRQDNNNNNDNSGGNNNNNDNDNNNNNNNNNNGDV